MSETNVERYEVEDQSPEADEMDVILLERDDETQGELTKFGILAIVLLFTVLIIALLRPYIFNTIIPAVLGEGQPTAPILDDADAETIKPDTEEAEESEAMDSEVESEANDASAETTEEVAEPENPEDFPTAVPAQTHTVQVGETLTAIARQYGVSVQAIVTANSITNPDRVAVGTVLIIPEAGNR